MPKSPIVSYSTSIDPVTGLVTRKVTNSNSAELKKHQRLKEESSHDRRASAEKALKERTEIEFFERGKCLSLSSFAKFLFNRSLATWYSFLYFDNRFIIISRWHFKFISLL